MPLPPAPRNERLMDRLLGIHNMMQSLQTQVLTCVSRGSVGENMRAEMYKKSSWITGEILDLRKDSEE